MPKRKEIEVQTIDDLKGEPLRVALWALVDMELYWTQEDQDRLAEEVASAARAASLPDGVVIELLRENVGIPVSSAFDPVRIRLHGDVDLRAFMDKHGLSGTEFERLIERGMTSMELDADDDERRYMGTVREYPGMDWMITAYTYEEHRYLVWTGTEWSADREEAKIYRTELEAKKEASRLEAPEDPDLMGVHSPFEHLAKDLASDIKEAAGQLEAKYETLAQKRVRAQGEHEALKERARIEDIVFTKDGTPLV